MQPNKEKIMAFVSQENRAVLKQYISNGKVNYDSLLKNDWLNQTYENIVTHDLQFSNETERFAFWINVYNVLTLKSVQLEFTKNPNWKGNTSILSKLRFFVFRKFKIGNSKVNLYNLENKILRKEFKDPRLHFVINCAATSCPFIPDRLIVASELEDTFETYTSDFINNQGGVILQNGKIYLSRIFKWYKKDFTEGIIPFIRKYWKGEQISDKVEIKYQNYDWSLNQI